MRAWQHIAINQPLRLLGLPMPVATPDDVVRSTLTAAMCRPDFVFWDGTHAGRPEANAGGYRDTEAQAFTGRSLASA
jgi:D-arabinose 1-dehydrogenase-like Zn-dependent alcohol dehydrogenase